MGNRSILHNDDRQIVRQWARKAWVSCVLDFQGVERNVFSPANYSELFFLDEATALAAGHRPCRACQRDKHDEFKRLWIRANMPDAERGSVPITVLDDALHAERVAADRKKRSYMAELAELPLGTIFEHKDHAYLVWKNGLRRWSFDGYLPASHLNGTMYVLVLTPESIVKTYHAGLEQAGTGWAMAKTPLGGKTPRPCDRGKGDVKRSLLTEAQAFRWPSRLQAPTGTT